MAEQFQNLIEFYKKKKKINDVENWGVSKIDVVTYYEVNRKTEDSVL